MLLTPRHWDTNVRMEMDISKEDHSVIRRGGGYYGTVTDLITNTRWKIYGASCGLPRCMCDARAKEVR